MRLVSVYIFLVVLLGLHQKGADAVRSLEVSSGGGGTVVDGSLQVCPDTTVSLTCSHDSPGDLTRWRVTPPLPMDCNTAFTHTNSPNSSNMCGLFTVSMISADSEPTRTSTLELVVTEPLNDTVVTCFAGGSTTDPTVGNFTIQVIGPPSVPTIDSIEYSVIDPSTGQVTVLAISAGMFGTNVSFYGSVEGISPLIVTDNNITVTGLSYTESHTVSVMATSDVCPGVLNSSATVVPVVFNIRTPVLTSPTGFVDCSNQSLPISGSWSVMEGVQSSSDPAVQLTPPLNDTPTVTYTSAGGLSGSAMFLPDSSYQLTDTVENDVYTFTVTVTNAAGSSSEMSAEIDNRALVIDNSTLETMTCLTFFFGQNCASEQSGDFSIQFEEGSGVCLDLRSPDFSTSTIQLTSQSTCVSVTSSADLCYRANLVYDGTIVDTQSNLNFNTCPMESLSLFVASGVSIQLNGEASSNLSHLTPATLSCTSVIYDLIGSPQITCIDGNFEPTGLRSCTIAVWLIVVIIIIILALILIGIVCGMVTARYLPSLLNRLSEKKCWAILAVILLVFLFGFGVGILFYICCCKQDSNRKSEPRDAEKLTRSTSPPADSLYADPKSIEHEAAPGTEDQYAMVDRKVKKNTKPKPTPPDALYQDPNTIEHKTAASGDTYAVVDKPKRSSKKEGGPDVVPPASEGLTYAEIDLSSKRPKPGSGRQAPQQPGEYPKEHPVEYSSVDHTSQL